MISTRKNSLTAPTRSSDCGRLKPTCAALMAALLLVTSVNSQAGDPPPAKARSTAGEKGGLLYSMNFEAGSVSDLKRAWMDAFTNDNFLITASAERVELPGFQMRDMSLTELARSIAFLSQGALTVEVVERSAAMPGNIWRVGRTSPEALSNTIKMRAVAAPHLFAHQDMLKRFLDEARRTQNQLEENLHYLQKFEGVKPWIRPYITPLEGQRVLVLIGSEEGISGLESLIKAAEETAAEAVKDAKGGK